jgi:hypothetical protein
MTSALVEAPRLVQLVVVRGEPGRPVRNLHFRHLGLRHTDWPIPPGGYQGQGVQACDYHTAATADGSQGRDVIVPSAVELRHAEGCSIEDSVLARLGGSGLVLGEGCVDSLVQGNLFQRIAGNGIGVYGGVPKGSRIENNVVRLCGERFYGAVGIWVGIAERTTIAHNTVYDLPYTGISVGWEWSPKATPCRENRIEANHVYNVMKRLCDGGCIYTLGWQPGTVIRGNYLHDVHRSSLAQGAPNNGMFIDEGSKGFLFEENVIHDTSAEPIRFNLCEKSWHTWKNNHFGTRAEVEKTGAATIAAAGVQGRLGRLFKTGAPGARP